MRIRNRIGQSGILLTVILLLFFTLAEFQMPAEKVRDRDEVWQKELLKEREQKDIEFKTSATSPMAGSVRLTITAPGKTFIKIAGEVVSAQPLAGAGTVFAVFSGQGKWFWNDAAPGVTCRLAERVIAPNTDELPAGSLFKAGRFTLAVYPGPEALAMIVFDPQRPQVLEFKHLRYYPPNLRFVVTADLERFATPKQVKVTTTRKLEKTFYRYARVHFRLAGKELTLTALKSSLEGLDAQYLFIPFKDATNGGETYEVGRFIDVRDPGQGEFILDFNRCYNPLCNYSPAYNCPLPPLENFLDVAILAGEKTYPH